MTLTQSMLITELLQQYIDFEIEEIDDVCTLVLGDNVTIDVHTSGDRRWYQNDKLHREDGPAIEYANGKKEWYQNGKQILR